MPYRQPRVGIVGAGQLARMTAQAAIPLDVRIVLLAATADDGAAQVTPHVVIGAPDDPHALRKLADQTDVITFDHELVDPALLAELEGEGVTVWPSSSSMALAQDKRRQRSELGALGLPVPPFAVVDTPADTVAFGDTQGWPIVIKASRGGYDGRGVWVVEDASSAERVVEGARASGTALLAEAFLTLDLEFAMLLARRPGGEMVLYPPIETVQADGICRELRVPASIEPRIATEAESVARRIAEHTGIVGIMAIEFFVASGRLYVNELAPRPHNSGHWSIEGAVTSQFEQHLRAVLDWPLGDTGATSDHVATVNLLGPADGSDPRGNLGAALGIEGVHPHFYGKESRPGRKIGHVTVTGTSGEDVERRAWRAHDALVGEQGRRR